MALTVYCWLLCLYPGSCRHEFGEEMTSVFRDARNTLPPALAAKIRFYRREFCGLLSCVRTLTVCSALSFLFGDSLCNARFVSLALPCF